MFRIFIIVILICLGSSSLFAKSDSKKGTVNVNFEDELISGDINKPELLYLLKQRQANYKRLIKFRENFLPEMRKTTEDLRQSRGEN